jgi:hypothetical protein
MDSTLKSTQGYGTFAITFGGKHGGYITQPTEWAKRNFAKYEYKTFKGSKAHPRRCLYDEAFRNMFQNCGHPSTWPSKSDDYVEDVPSDDEGISVAAFALKSPTKTPPFKKARLMLDDEDQL